MIDPATGNPASFSITGADGAQVLSLAGQPITLAPGASLSVHVTAATSATSCATYDNTASVTSTNDGNPTAGPVTITVNCGDLAITKTADAAERQRGHPDRLPSSRSPTTARARSPASPGQPTPCPAATRPRPDHAIAPTLRPRLDRSRGGVLSFGPAPLAPGASVAVHVTRPTTAATCGTVDNSAAASSLNDGNPSVGPVPIVVNCADLQLTKTADAASVSAGDPIGYTVTISNAGLGTATGVTLADSLPGGNAAAPVHWVIDPATGNPASFSITGADGARSSPRGPADHAPPGRQPLGPRHRGHQRHQLRHLRQHRQPHQHQRRQPHRGPGDDHRQLR